MIEALLIEVLFLISRSPFFPELHSYYMSCVQTDYVYQIWGRKQLLVSDVFKPSII